MRRESRKAQKRSWADSVIERWASEANLIYRHTNTITVGAYTPIVAVDFESARKKLTQVWGYAVVGELR